MNDKVIDLKGKPVTRDFGATDPAMIEFIEDVLRRAKEGKLLAMVGGFIQENGENRKFTMTYVFCEEGIHNAALGVLGVAQHRLVKKMDD